MLTLTIRKKWFDMMVSGVKVEEYREIKPYYTSRFKEYINKRGYVKFRNGYDKSSPFFICWVHYGIGTGKPEWGAEKNRVYYVLSIESLQYNNVYITHRPRC